MLPRPVEAGTMTHLGKRSARTAPDKTRGQQTRCGATLSGGAIRGQRCGAVAGMSLHAPMT